MLNAITTALRRVLHALAAPVRGDRGRGGIVVYPYRGYASRDEAFLMGRIFRQPASRSTARAGGAGRDAIDLGRRILRHGVGGATLVARFRSGRRITSAT